MALRIIAIFTVLASSGAMLFALYTLHPALLLLVVSLTILVITLGWIRSRWGVSDDETETPYRDDEDDDGRMEVRPL